MSKSESSLLIVEPNAHGHQMNYVRIIAQEAVRQNIAVTIATFEQSLLHSSYRVIAEELAGKYQEQVIPLPSGMKSSILGQNEYRKHLAFRRIYQQFFDALSKTEQSSEIFVPFLNNCDKAVSLLGSPFGKAKWSGLIMRDTFHHAMMGVLSPPAKSDKIKERIFRRLLSNASLTALFSIDEVLPIYVKQNLPRLAGKFHYAPDPVLMRGQTSRKEARKLFGIADDVPVLLVYGAISSRKGIAELLAATQQEVFPSDVHILMAGEQNSEIKELLATELGARLRAQKRLTEWQGFLDDEKEYDVFRASDAVWVGYRHHYGSSGVILQAAAMGLPVLSCREGLLGWRTRNHQIGISVQVTNAQETAQSMRQLFWDSTLREQWRTQGLKLAEQHTPQHFARIILSGIFGTDFA